MVGRCQIINVLCGWVTQRHDRGQSPSPRRYPSELRRFNPRLQTKLRGEKELTRSFMVGRTAWVGFSGRNHLSALFPPRDPGSQKKLSRDPIARLMQRKATAQTEGRRGPKADGQLWSVHRDKGRPLWRICSSNQKRRTWGAHTSLRPDSRTRSSTRQRFMARHF